MKKCYYNIVTKRCSVAKEPHKPVTKPIAKPISKRPVAPKKKTIAQIKKECKKKGLVYDAIKKNCRESLKRGKKPVSKPVPSAPKPVSKKPVKLKKSCVLGNTGRCKNAMAKQDDPQCERKPTGRFRL